MLASDFLSKMKQRIRERVESLGDSLARGGAADFNAYCKTVGRIQGLLELEDIIKEIQTRSEEEDGQ